MSTAQGTGNMGTVTTDGSVARWRRGGRFRLSTLSVVFTGGTGSANMGVWKDDHRDVWADKLLYTFESVGTSGKNAAYRVTPDEYEYWTFEPGDELVLVWTNPDSGTMEWHADVELADA